MARRHENRTATVRADGNIVWHQVALWLAATVPLPRQRSCAGGATAASGPPGCKPSGSPEEVARRLYMLIPERMPPRPRRSIRRTRRACWRSPDGCAARIATPAWKRACMLTIPVLAVFGTRDTMIPPEMGRIYKDLISDSHLVFVPDAGHAIAWRNGRMRSWRLSATSWNGRTLSWISRTKTVCCCLSSPVGTFRDGAMDRCPLLSFLDRRVCRRGLWLSLVQQALNI